jgi:hypothetical protein
MCSFYKAYDLPVKNNAIVADAAGARQVAKISGDYTPTLN